MPKDANLQQRIDWHIAHAAACGCRDVPQSVKTALEVQGKPLPPRRQL